MLKQMAGVIISRLPPNSFEEVRRNALTYSVRSSLAINMTNIPFAAFVLLKTMPALLHPSLTFLLDTAAGGLLAAAKARCMFLAII